MGESYVLAFPLNSMAVLGRRIQPQKNTTWKWYEIMEGKQREKNEAVTAQISWWHCKNAHSKENNSGIIVY